MAGRSRGQRTARRARRRSTASGAATRSDWRSGRRGGLRRGQERERAAAAVRARRHVVRLASDSPRDPLPRQRRRVPAARGGGIRAAADAAGYAAERHPLLRHRGALELRPWRRSLLPKHRQRRGNATHPRWRRDDLERLGGLHRAGGDAPLRGPLVGAGRQRHRLHAGGHRAHPADLPPGNGCRRRSRGRAALSLRRWAERGSAAGRGGHRQPADPVARLVAGQGRLPCARAVLAGRSALRPGAVAGSEAVDAAPLGGWRLGGRPHRDFADVDQPARQPDLPRGRPLPVGDRRAGAGGDHAQPARGARHRKRHSGDQCRTHRAHRRRGCVLRLGDGLRVRFDHAGHLPDRSEQGATRPQPRRTWVALAPQQVDR